MARGTTNVYKYCFLPFISMLWQDYDVQLWFTYLHKLNDNKPMTIKQLRDKYKKMLVLENLEKTPSADDIDAYKKSAANKARKRREKIADKTPGQRQSERIAKAKVKELTPMASENRTTGREEIEQQDSSDFEQDIKNKVHKRLKSFQRRKEPIVSFLNAHEIIFEESEKISDLKKMAYKHMGLIIEHEKDSVWKVENPENSVLPTGPVTTDG